MRGVSSGHLQPLSLPELTQEPSKARSMQSAKSLYSVSSVSGTLPLRRRGRIQEVPPALARDHSPCLPSAVGFGAVVPRLCPSTAEANVTL